MKAIKLLEVTSARLIENNLEYAKEIGISSDFITATNRNDGLIGITEKSINETRKWQEYAHGILIGRIFVLIGAMIADIQEQKQENYIMVEL